MKLADTQDLYSTRLYASHYGYGGPTIIRSTDIGLLLEDYFKAFHSAMSC